MRKFLLLIILAFLFSEPFDGMTLITTRGNDESSISQTILIDNDLNIINTWIHDTRLEGIAYLSSDSILYIQPKINTSEQGIGGRYKKITWNGDVIWDYTLDICKSHHDISVLPNGNILSICTEFKSFSEVYNVGYDSEFDSLFGIDMIVELEPVGSNDANIVWQWHFWDHLIQEINPNLENYGQVNEHPELLDINVSMTSNSAIDWLHLNCISYNKILDQVVISSRRSSEFYVIDHSTTSEQAASHSGGQYGKGGDFLYRWGNPQNYKRGLNQDKILGAPHGVNWIPEGYLGAGNFLLFNNRHEFFGPENSNNVSAVLEIESPIDLDGSYLINNTEPFAPSSYSWSYETDFSDLQSGAFRLPNNNTIITIAATESIIEVNYEGNIELNYGNDYNTSRAIKYGYDYFDTAMPGDLNEDEIINILDVIIMVNYILTSNFNENADFNSDGTLDVLDIITLVNIIINS